MPILYVETNFLMSIALGRDAEANNLLVTPPASIQIAIPGVCCMESLSAFEAEQKRRYRFMGELNQQISQLKRDLTSVYARTLLSYLEQSQAENIGLKDDVARRLFLGLDNLATNAEIIPLTSDIIRESLNADLIADEPTDNLILHSILFHPRSHPTEVKVLLTDNTKDFANAAIREVLQNAGVNKYFTRAASFLGWLQSL